MKWAHAHCGDDVVVFSELAVGCWLCLWDLRQVGEQNRSVRPNTGRLQKATVRYCKHLQLLTEGLRSRIQFGIRRDIRRGIRRGIQRGLRGLVAKLRLSGERVHFFNLTTSTPSNRKYVLFCP